MSQPTSRTSAGAQFLRFAAVGLTAAALNLVSFLVTVDLLGIPYMAATVIVFFIGNLWGWAANRIFTFRSEARRTPELARYLAVMAVSLSLNLLCMYALVDIMGVHYLVASVVVGVAFLAGNFLVQRRVTFRAV